MARRLFTISLFVFLLSCSSEPSTASARPTPEHVNTGVRQSDAVSDPVIILETSGVWCSPCPSLRISIYENKPASLEAEFYEQTRSGTINKKVASKTQNLSTQQLEKLRLMLDEMSFFDLADSYVPKIDATGRFVPSANCPKSLSDGPTYNISYRQNDRLKTVTHYDSCEPDDNVRKLPAFEKHVMDMFSAYEFLGRRADSSNVNTSAPNRK